MNSKSLTNKYDFIKSSKPQNITKMQLELN